MDEKKFTSADYFLSLNENKITGTKCKECGLVQYPARAICENCLSENLEETPISGKGELAAFSVIYIPPSALVDAGFGRENPNIAGIVELSEGPMVSAQILGLDPFKPEDIKIGTPLKSVFVERSGQKFLAFEAE